MPAHETTEAPPAPPDVTYQHATWTAERLADTAATWHAHITRSVSSTADAVGIVMQSHPQTIALFFAVSALSLPVVLLHPEPTTWRSDPAFPRAMPVLLPPVAERFRVSLEAAGLSAVVMPAASGPEGLSPPRFFATPGFVIFTSGSTGVPKPTFRSTRGVIQAARTVARTFGLPRAARVAGCLPLATSFGLTQNIVLPAVVGGHVSLLDRFDHRSLLNLFAEERFDYWPGTALMADLLVRAPIDRWSGQAPAICNVSSGHLPATVYRRFLERFGVPLRQSYGRSECSFITADPSPLAQLAPETVGFPSPGVEIRCGESPDDPVPPGAAGRIWIRCPWHSEGYGYPPDLQPMARPDGWCPTEDMGQLTAEGRLIILGRIDDCFKTTGGFLVSPALVVRALRDHSAVVDAAVVPVRGHSGAVIGIVAAARDGVRAADILALAGRALPPWLRPAVVVIRPSIPSLPSGKHDRAACIRLLEAEMAGDTRQAVS
jgi:long-chain acyl-CoA synthetase